jgi:hypothetical protein
VCACMQAIGHIVKRSAACDVELNSAEPYFHRADSEQIVVPDGDASVSFRTAVAQAYDSRCYERQMPIDARARRRRWEAVVCLFRLPDSHSTNNVLP